MPDRLNAEIEQKVEKFTKEMLRNKQSGHYYKRNRRTSLEKAEKDIRLGKKSEFFASYALSQMYVFPFVEPDLEIRTGKDKGWRKDLVYDDVELHVKSCSLNTVDYCGDYSWTFQYADEYGGQDSIFMSKNDLVVLVYMDEYKSKEGELVGILPWNKINPALKDPVKESLRGIKKCLYLSDIN